MNSSLSIKGLWELLVASAREWNEDNASRCAAALAYYTAVAIAPLVVLMLVLVVAFWDEKMESAQLASYLSDIAGSASADLFREIIASAKRPVLGSWAGILSVLVLAWGASNVFAQLQDALNKIWDAPPPEEIRFTRKVYKRILSFAMVLALGFLLLVSLALSAALEVLGQYFQPLASGSNILLHVINATLSLVVITALIAAIYRVLPDVEIGWRQVILGAVLTAALFSLGKSALGWYLGRASTSSAYGAAGSLVVFLLWVYYSAQIFFFGAEFTQVYARRAGQGREAAPGKPAPGAPAKSSEWPGRLVPARAISGSRASAAGWRSRRGRTGRGRH